MKPTTAQFVQKAERAIRAAVTMRSEGSNDFAASRAYYAMFYIASALLNEQDLQFGKHGAVHAAFGKEFAKTGAMDSKFHRWLLDAFDKRSQADYDVQFSIVAEDVEEMIEQAREFLTEARNSLRASGPKS